MKRRYTMVALGGSLLTAVGCGNYGFRELNRNVSPIPPAGAITHRETLPPAEMLMHPGPGVDGPGPGVMMNDPNAVPPGAGIVATQSSQMHFVGPDGMSVAWDVSTPGAFDSEPLVAPGRYNFPQAAIYRLKLSNIPGRPGVELYPTLEVAPPTPRSEAYLAHNAVPVQFTEEDLDQVLSGNFVTKVIYLPDAEFQELALAGVETLVSTRLDPGLDPIVEADRRGAIMAIIRIGNKDLEVPGSEIVDGGPGPGGVFMGAGGFGGPGFAGSQAGFGPGCGPACGAGNVGPNAAYGIPPAFVAGVTAPEYGMTSSGTPIGLPGPPHLPLGIPAGMKRHIITNDTKFHIPPPVQTVDIRVKQEPGLSYPKPPSHVRIVERSHTAPVRFHQPKHDKHEFDYDAPTGGPAADCPVDGGAEDCQP